MDTEMKFIYATVLRPATGLDTTKNGLSSRYNSVYIPCDKGNVSVSDLVNKENVLFLFGNGFVPRSVNLDSMPHFGGNFVYCNDDRFAAQYGDKPVKIYDRIENYEGILKEMEHSKKVDDAISTIVNSIVSKIEKKISTSNKTK